MRLPGVRWFSLQRGPAQAQWRSEWGADLSSDEPAQTAAVMRTLDLVISVDSMPAHLAGALGVPVWTLLHSEPDWRWMAGREDSAWYPTMRLFRQPQPGDWNSVAQRVGFELARQLRR
jgi:ADP-heptose:LPS heptosyltransferase